MHIKTISIFLIFALLFNGCSTERKEINGQYYTQYGILNEDTDKNPEIDYEINVQNSVLMLVFCWTLVAPLYLGGFYLYKPVKMNDSIFSIHSKKGLVELKK